MSKRTLTDIIKQWRAPIKKRNDKPSRSEVMNTIKQSPDSLEAKLAVSPYAKILASPLRKCTFHGRFFPSKLLLRFGQGWHQPTKLLWAYPTFKKSNGKGIYVNLSKQVLETFGKGRYKAAFRGSTTYRSDMLDHVEHMLFQESFKEFSKHPLSTFHMLTTSSPSTWSTNTPSPMGYQCILLFDPTSSTACCELNQQIMATNTTHYNIPCYHMHKFWSKENIESIQNQLNIIPNAPIALGVPKNLETVDLAVALWRCRKFLS